MRAIETALDGQWKVDVESAVDGTGFEMRRVLLRNPQVDPAVARFDVEPFAFPAGTFEIDIDAAVARAALDVTGHVGELDAAVDGAEFDLSIDVAHADAAVGRFE